MAAETAHSGGGLTHHHIVMLGSSCAVLLFILVTAMMARPGIGVVPRGWGAVYEHTFDWLDGLAQDLMGREGRNYVPFAMTLFLFILASNWSGLLPLPILGSGEELTQYEPPSTSYNTTLALALISFLAFNYFGLKKRLFPPKDSGAGLSHGHDDHDHGHHSPGGLAGLGVWIAHFWQPTPELWKTMEGALKYLMVPFLAVLFILLNFIEEWARIISLSFRLFGNISGEHQVKASLLDTMYTYGGQMVEALSHGQLAGLFAGILAIVIWAISLFAMCLGALAGFIQAMIFAVLTLSYIGHAVADEH
ncbi:MAG: FoF1 ATP synthase subunit a [Candidatus Eremiobacterota bacterium]